MRHYAIASAAALALIGTAAIATQSGHGQHPPTSNEANTARPAPTPPPPPPTEDEAPEANTTTNNTQTPPPPPPQG